MWYNIMEVCFWLMILVIVSGAFILREGIGVKYCKNCKYYLGIKLFWNLFHDYYRSNPACIVAHKKRKLNSVDIAGRQEYNYPVTDNKNAGTYNVEFTSNHILIVTCELLNSKYNCKYYKKKWWKFWLKEKISGKD